MQLSLNWLKEYIDFDLDPTTVGDILTSIGLEVEGMEMVESIPGGLAGVVVGHVLECDRHPNADRLSLTKVDVGGEEPLQIVCGAPNVAAGQKVLVATVGTTLHPTEGDPFTIKKGKIRGEASVGMICAEDELGLGTSHDGIIVLEDAPAVGTPAREVYELETDYVYEIGLTPNRSDATNHLGSTKDLLATLMVNYEHDGKINLPQVDGFAVNNTDATVAVEVRHTEACPRYSGVSITNLKIGPSPDWMQRRLAAVGVRPINNVVDITNFVLHELGQPLHAFDLEKIAGQKIVVDTLPAGTAFESLDEVERKLLADDLMICDGELQPMCIGGVFGGAKSGVTDATTSIFLEAAHFNAKYIRRSSMKHNLRTDAAKVFEKGSDPNITVYALKRAALLMQELAGGVIASEVVDIYPEPVQPTEVTVRYAQVNDLIGLDMDRDAIHNILDALAMKRTATTDETFTVAVPTNKADVTRPADVIEEILRIYGFNNVPLPGSIQLALTVAPDPDPRIIHNTIGDMLAGQGYYEMMSLSLSESCYYETHLPDVVDELVQVNNTSNVHLNVMRANMVFSGLEAIQRNQNRQEMNLRLYEFGRTYHKNEAGEYDEPNHLSLFLTGARYAESWHNTGVGSVSFFTLKNAVEVILDRLGISGYQQSELEDPVFSYGLRYHRGPQDIVQFGKVDKGLVDEFGLRQEVFYADFNWDRVFKALPKKGIEVQELSRFPSVRRDLALVVDKTVRFSEVEAIAKKQAKKLLQDVNLFDWYENENQLGVGKKSYAVSFVFQDASKTLKDKEVDKQMQQLIRQYEQKLGAHIRS
ncbi:MAG: phenylalanine--tRNA ligase subunit beta [Bacteroidota bacterium]